MFTSRYGKLAGTTYDEVLHNVRKEYRLIQRRTKRQPYVRSKYFRSDKVFIATFFNHLFQKRKGEQHVRLQFFLAAIDLIRNIRDDPQTIVKSENLNEILHRFAGQTKNSELFYVQIKQNKRTNRKDFMSVFPAKQKK